MTRDTFQLVIWPRIGTDDPLPPEDREPWPNASVAKLYHLHGPRLLRYFKRKTDHQDADDLVNESFVRFVSAAAVRDGRVDCAEAYLNQIASNLLRDRARSALHRSLARHVPIDKAAVADGDPVTMLEARDKLDRLQRALLRMKPKTRSIFLEHRLDGLSYKEIAERNGLSVKGVEWHMTKAINHLDRALKG
jgi:RNA polymerase sigma-70 factor (ECF subfamily)